ncbi:MAG TPA: L-ribulose-5-phosphate 4-epimerase AraD [Vicinamibacterales bacterium]|nr:L-ribulose-5-phosphate 4-epimerase AraD [Vicinamibacterales bacterium]
MSRIPALRREVLEANLELVRRGLVVSSFGNASGIDREAGRVVIKPSGVPYDRLTEEDLVVTDLDGHTIEGRLRPSSDLPTHLALYRAFATIGGVAHTHSRHATAWAQAGREIPCLGTTHADYFQGPVPVTEPMRPAEIRAAYEWNTGQVIVRRFASLNPAQLPAVLVHGHAPFCWGPSAPAAAEIAVLLEEIAALAAITVALNPAASAISPVLRDKHFLRKHGPGAYYGQK